MSTVGTLTKTAGGVLLALTQQATAVITVGSAVNVATAIAANVFVKMGRTVATALTNEVKFRLEGSAKSSANDEWYPIQEWSSTLGKTIANTTTLNGATTAGNTTSVITSATGIAAGDILYFRETSTPANSEWSRVASQSGTTSTFEEAQTRSHTNSIAVSDNGEIFPPIFVNCAAHGRLRLVVDSASAASGQTVDVIAWIETLDSTLST